MSDNANEQVAALYAVQMVCDRCLGISINLGQLSKVASNIKMIQATIRQQGWDNAQQNKNTEGTAVERILLVWMRNIIWNIDPNLNSQCDDLNNWKFFDLIAYRTVFLWDDFDQFCSYGRFKQVQ